MSTIEERRAVAMAGVDGAADGFATRIFLQPIAAPSILGLFGFAAATFIVAANVAGWYGNHSTTPLVLAPFAAVFGGIAQFMAGMWAYRARDAVARVARVSAPESVQARAQPSRKKSKAESVFESQSYSFSS